MTRVDDLRLNDFLRTRVKLLEPIVSEIVRELLELRAFKDSMEPSIEWVEGQSDSWALPSLFEHIPDYLLLVKLGL
jgi:hypothetical protein